ncbi:Hypothetical protein NTJ_13963 [Nesidiocoris tenuis]|uniref:Uncharacterized protein n=1 Tax=Nesidiocoris tenuis TaxID=355587 RepID=A0ABN7BBV7_9HEMI|nr:Hypothetical protein NTJ_13963 [Nesidiocoris tenuis]
MVHTFGFEKINSRPSTRPTQRAHRSGIDPKRRLPPPAAPTILILTLSPVQKRSPPPVHSEVDRALIFCSGKSFDLILRFPHDPDESNLFDLISSRGTRKSVRRSLSAP